MVIESIISLLAESMHDSGGVDTHEQSQKMMVLVIEQIAVVHDAMKKTNQKNYWRVLIWLYDKQNCQSPVDSVATSTQLDWSCKINHKWNPTFHSFTLFWHVYFTQQVSQRNCVGGFFIGETRWFWVQSASNHLPWSTAGTLLWVVRVHMTLTTALLSNVADWTSQEHPCFQQQRNWSSFFCFERGDNAIWAAPYAITLNIKCGS